jgi:hypothetical protein
MKKKRKDFVVKYTPYVVFSVAATQPADHAHFDIRNREEEGKV